MSFLESIFGNSSSKDNSKVPVSWIALTSLEQLDTIDRESNATPAVIFKHSTRCGISRSVLKRFESEFDQTTNATFYFLDLLKYREVSSEIAVRFSVRHESPQLLLIKNGKCIYNASHGHISFAAIENLD